MHLLDVQAEKDEGLSVQDFKDMKTLDKEIAQQKAEEKLRIFFFEQNFWRDTISTFCQNMKHLGIWEDLNTAAATPICVGLECKWRFNMKKSVVVEFERVSQSSTYMIDL